MARRPAIGNTLCFPSMDGGLVDAEALTKFCLALVEAQARSLDIFACHSDDPMRDTYGCQPKINVEYMLTGAMPYA